MNLRPLIIVSAVVSLFAFGCGGGADPTQEPTVEGSQSPTATATAEPGVANGQVGAGKTMRSADGVLEVSATGGGVLDVSVREVAKDAPATPAGWTAVSRVYEITAREPAGGRPVTQLKEPFQLRFKSGEPLAMVLSWDGDSWEVVRSDLANGVVEARVDHLSPYAVMRPSTLGQRATPSATATTAVQPPATTTPATSPDAAKAALESAIRKYTGEAAALSGTNVYGGAAELSVPQTVTAALAEAGVFGDVFHGLYNGVSEGFWSKATEGTAVGEYVLLIEPQTAFAHNTSEAQRLLVALFPGAAGLQYAPVQSGPTAYTYQASNASSFVVLGFVQHEGLPLAFVSAGSGLYTHAVVTTK